MPSLSFNLLLTSQGPIFECQEQEKHFRPAVLSRSWEMALEQFQSPEDSHKPTLAPPLGSWLKAVLWQG